MQNQCENNQKKLAALGLMISYSFGILLTYRDKKMSDNQLPDKIKFLTKKYQVAT